MNDVIYARLIQAAKERRLVSYTDLAAAIGLSITSAEGIKALGKMLDDIADHELACGRPLLPVLIVRDETNMPGTGLFKYAKRRGLMKGKSDIELFAEELGRVYATWGEPQS